VVGGVPRAFASWEAVNRLAYADQDAIRRAWSELTGRPIDERFRLVPPIHSPSRCVGGRREPDIQHRRPQAVGGLPALTRSALSVAPGPRAPISTVRFRRDRRGSPHARSALSVAPGPRAPISTVRFRRDRRGSPHTRSALSVAPGHGPPNLDSARFTTQPKRVAPVRSSARRSVLVLVVSVPASAYRSSPAYSDRRRSASGFVPPPIGVSV
jgi:hypothetical protein